MVADPDVQEIPMTQRRLIVSLAFLVLMVGIVPVVGAGEPAAPTGATASLVQAPAPTGPELKKPEELLGSGLFTPAPTAKCQAGACWGNGTPCEGDEGPGACTQLPQWGCGICVACDCWGADTACGMFGQGQCSVYQDADCGTCTY